MTTKKRPKTPLPTARATLKSAVPPQPRGGEAVPVERKRKKTKVPAPSEVQGAFSPVEIDFFERAADMYADEYDVWDDFRPPTLN